MKCLLSCVVMLGLGVVRAFAVDAGEFGFSPSAEPTANVAALQKALDGGNKTVTVSLPGEYRLNARVYLDDATTVRFAPGVVLKKTGRYDFVLCNRGALTRTWNHDLAIDGLTIAVNGVDTCPQREDPLFGLRGHLTFYFARNVTVSNFTCRDVRQNQFCLHFCRFENLLLDTFEIRGEKDGVHIGAGRNFVVRNGVCATYDDGVALNAQDYPTSQPMQGDIADGLVENVRDVRKEKTGGNSVRMLAGAWPDWRSGIVLKNGDTVRHGRNVYRVLLKDVRTNIVSTVTPIHEQGVWTDPAGLTFFHSQNDGAVSATVRNVRFRGLRFEEERNAFKVAWDFCSANRAIHPDTPKERYPVIEARIEDVVAGSARPFVQGNASFRLAMDGVKCAGPLLLIHGNRDTLCELDARRVALAYVGADRDLGFDGAGSLNAVFGDVTQKRDASLVVGKEARVRITGGVSLASTEGLTPVRDDTIRVGGAAKRWDGTAWR